MAKVRGTGIAAVNYPTGMNLGGDPSQALIHATTTGTFVISLSSTDLGQGLKTVLAQIGAEALGVPFEYVMTNLLDGGTTSMKVAAAEVNVKLEPGIFNEASLSK